MAFAGFNFRNTLAGPTGFTGDNGFTFVNASTAAYSSGQGYGWTSLIPTHSNSAGDTSTWTGEVAGYASMNSNSHIFRVDLANGTYKVRIANGVCPNSGAVNTGLVLYDGDTSGTALITINHTSAEITNTSVMDATGAIIANALWDNNQVEVTVQVSQGFVSLKKYSTYIGAVRHLSFELQTSPLEDAKLETDDTGWSLDDAGATTSAGDPVVTGLSVAANLRVGMRAHSANLPAGGVLIDSIDVAGSSVTLASGTGVLAGTATMTFGYDATLYEKSPSGRHIAPITLVVGVDTGLVVYEADGVTVNPYIEVVDVDGHPWFAYTSTRMPDAGGGTYTFKLSQTDSSTSVTGSPHVTTFALPFVSANDRPVDATVEGQMTTPAWLRQKEIRDYHLTNNWVGYNGETFYATATVKSWSELFTQLATYAALAAANRWFMIMLSDGVGSNWSSAANTSTGYNFLPELGGGCYITNAVGMTPKITGGIYGHGMRGIHINQIWNPCITPYSTGTIGFRINEDSSFRNLCVFTNCRFGYLTDTATYTDPPNDLRKYRALAYDGVYTGSTSEQMTFLDCIFRGCGQGIDSEGTHRLRVQRCDFGYQSNDCIATKILDPVAHAGYYDNLDTYDWFEDNIFHLGTDNVDLYGFIDVALSTKVTRTITTTLNSPVVTIDDSSGLSVGMGVTGTYAQGLGLPKFGFVIASIDSPTQITVADGQGVTALTGVSAEFHWGFELDGAHPDFNQQRGAAYTNPGIRHLLATGNRLVMSSSRVAIGQDGRYWWRDTQFLIWSDSVEQECVVYNNFLAHSTVRGIDTGKGISYVEFNTLAPSPSVPNVSASNVFSVPTITTGSGTEGVTAVKSYKNIAYTVTNPLVYAQGDLYFNYQSPAVDPGDYMAGAFTLDAYNRWGFALTDDETTTGVDVAKAVYNMLKRLPGVDAGALSLKLLVENGEGLTATQAATVAAETEKHTVGTIADALSVRWNSGAGETGSPAGYDVTFDVT